MSTREGTVRRSRRDPAGRPQPPDPAPPPADPPHPPDSPDAGGPPDTGAAPAAAASLRAPAAGATAPAPGAGQDVAGWLRTAATFAPPLTAVTALMFYFGWVRDWEESRVLGIDVGVLGLTTQDYLLDSISGLWRPMGVSALALLGWFVLHQRLVDAVATGQHRRAVVALARVLLAAWLVLPLVAWLVHPAELRSRHDGGLLFPAAIAVGVPLSAYGAWLLRRTRGAASRISGLGVLLCGAVVALALFWELSDYGAVVGTRLALIVADPSKGTQPGVVVYSPRNLEISAPGVVVNALPGPDAAYGFRYSGLRLLERSGGQYFLLPDGWSPRQRMVLVIPDDGTLRFEFGTG